MTGFGVRLNEAVLRKQTAALVGIDPRLDDLPAPVIRAAEARCRGSRAQVVAAAYEEFCFRLIDVVAPLVPAVKPQSAFFEQAGPEGVAVLARVIRKARDAGLIVICDAKRGDIGSTAEAYAAAYLAGEDPDAAPFAADAVTVNPYLGSDTLEPFVKLAPSAARVSTCSRGRATREPARFRIRLPKDGRCINTSPKWSRDWPPQRPAARSTAPWAPSSGRPGRAS